MGKPVTAEVNTKTEVVVRGDGFTSRFSVEEARGIFHALGEALQEEHKIEKAVGRR